MDGVASFNPAALASRDWFVDGRNDSLFVEAYELALAPEAIARKIFRFNEMVILIKIASLEYAEVAGVRMKFGPERQVEMSAEHRRSISDSSPKLITVQPFSRADPNGESRAADRSLEYVSLLVSSNFRNIACRKLFAHIVDAQDGSMIILGDLVRLPFDLPVPDLSHDALARFPRCREEMDRRDSNQRAKICLSLHWHMKGVQTNGLDSFLSLWIALETLTMDSTNIAGMNRALASAYATTAASASKEFGAGRLFGLRSKIVHNGLRHSVSADLTDYMECLYADLLMHELLGQSSGRARAFLTSKGIDLIQLTEC